MAVLKFSFPVIVLDELLKLISRTIGMRKRQRFVVCLCGLIVRVRVVPRRTVVGDIDRRFDNLSGSHVT